MSPRLCTLAVLAALTSSAGCSLLVSTDGFEGGERPVTDAGRDASDTSTSTPEAGVDGSAVRFCDSLPKATTLACTDFDGPSLPAEWRREGDTPPVVDQGLASSPSSSLLCVVKALPSGQSAESSLRFPFTFVPRIRARWSLYREPGAAGTEYNMGAFSFSDGSRFVLVQLQVGSDGTIGMQEYGEPGPDGKSQYSDRPPETVTSTPGKWTRLTLSVDWSAPGGPGVSATVDDAPLFTDYKMVGASRLGPITESFHLTGITYTSGPRGETRLRLDDIAVETF